ncbi:hypothetical protein K438DRAFT_2146126 [Mycena galopus ATCC 62051]|nr:hypothetical protein K438DRAFT_2146126 [Mycena galopus ATCC 62051]
MKLAACALLSIFFPSPYYPFVRSEDNDAWLRCTSSLPSDPSRLCIHPRGRPSPIAGWFLPSPLRIRSARGPLHPIPTPSTNSHQHPPTQVAYLPADASTAAALPAVTTTIIESTSSTSTTFSTTDGTTHTTSTATSTSVRAIPPSPSANTDANTATAVAQGAAPTQTQTQTAAGGSAPAAAAPDDKFSCTDTATTASSPTDAATTGDSATATDGSNATAPPPGATAGTDSQTQTQPRPQTLTTATGASAAVPTVSRSGASGAAANGSNGSSSSFLRKPAFIGALAAVSVLLALLALFLVLLLPPPPCPRPGVQVRRRDGRGLPGDTQEGKGPRYRQRAAPRAERTLHRVVHAPPAGGLARAGAGVQLLRAAGAVLRRAGPYPRAAVPPRVGRVCISRESNANVKMVTAAIAVSPPPIPIR